MERYNYLEIREVFHLEFLRWLAQKLKLTNYVLKGGVNLRFFFRSIRYSEDMDLDITKVNRDVVKEIVMKILQSPSFCDALRVFGIEKVVPPDISKAKQTDTTQRFKVHLITASGEDLFTKVEFSRRGFRGNVVVESVPELILRKYKTPPLLIPHYDIYSVVSQKINALATRTVVQARDIFDLYMLSSQYVFGKDSSAFPSAIANSVDKLQSARDNVFNVSFEQFRDTVLSYLSEDDKTIYNNPQTWDELRLKVVNLIEELKNQYG